MKRQVLFVDDEPNILLGLRSRLRRQRERWDIHLAGSAREALTLLGNQPIDVIVSDMRMPDMDGATLLRLVLERFPQVVRIVLSAHAEVETALRAVPVAHQFLSKPCDPGVLEEVVERACELQRLVSDDAVQRLVGRIDKLPASPQVYRELSLALSRDDVGAKEVAQILKKDMALSAKVLQIVNSAFFRLSRTLSQVEEAVTYLGFDAVKRVVLAAEVFSSLRPVRCGPLTLSGIQDHALRVATLASRLAPDKKTQEDAFVAGLLHDIGRLILMAELTGEYTKVALDAQKGRRTLHEQELQTWGISHAEVGAYLLGIWGLPYPIVEAVANHHQPLRAGPAQAGILAATYVANVLVEEVERAQGPAQMAGSSVLDPDYISALGFGDRLTGWREQAKNQARTP